MSYGWPKLFIISANSSIICRWFLLVNFNTWKKFDFSLIDLDHRSHSFHNPRNESHSLIVSTLSNFANACPSTINHQNFLLENFRHFSKIVDLTIDNRQILLSNLTLRKFCSQSKKIWTIYLIYFLIHWKLIMPNDLFNLQNGWDITNFLNLL